MQLTARHFWNKSLSVTWLADRLERERDRLVLWGPVCFGAGIAGYFSSPAEPPVWLTLAGIPSVAGLCYVLRARVVPLLVCLAVLLGGAGVATAQLRTALVAAPVVAESSRAITLTGRIVALEERPGGRRAVLDRPVVADWDSIRTPARIRLRLPGDAPLEIGQRIRVRARLRPPPPPSVPGGYDFARRAYFQRIGAVGFAVSHPERVASLQPSGILDRSWLAVDRWRQRLSGHVRETIDGRRGAVAAALITGDRSGITEETLREMRAAGLAHLLAISGLHMGLVAGLLFGATRFGLAAVPFIALRFQIKKWAACVALAGGLVYLMLAGATVPTQRAYLMAALVLFAVLLDRSAISMRLVAVAAGVVLLFRPESLLGPSFQMSFAAVVALVAAYERVSIRRGIGAGRRSLGGRAAGYVAGILLTTAIAGTATGLFALHHFGRATTYGLIANVIAIPVTAFWVMPAGIAGMLAMPLGLDAPFLWLMGTGIEVVLDLAGVIASWPYAERLVPVMPVAPLALCTLGGLWICLWRTRWRSLGLVALACGGLLYGMTPKPDLFITGNAKLVGIVDPVEGLSLSSGRAQKWAARTWGESVGSSSRIPWPVPGKGGERGMACDPAGCILRRDGWTVAIVDRREALVEDCRRADLLIARFPVRMDCEATVVIDRFDLLDRGAHAIYLGSQDEVRVVTVAETRGDRPWTARPGRQPMPKRKLAGDYAAR